MVHLSRIYTRFGDGGNTMLGDGSVVPKTSLRVRAYGAVDEANAAIGVAISECGRADGSGAIAAPGGSHAQDIRALLLRLQQDMFDVGADLCTPIGSDEKPGARLRVSPEYATRLEGEIDRFNAPLAPLNTFVLPGGAPLAAALHVARTITRRAEVEVVALLEAEPASTNHDAMVFLNRLSDLLFVLARAANEDGRLDVLWKPGANR